MLVGGFGGLVTVSGPRKQKRGLTIDSRRDFFHRSNLPSPESLVNVPEGTKEIHYNSHEEGKEFIEGSTTRSEEVEELKGTR